MNKGIWRRIIRAPAVGAAGFFLAALAVGNRPVPVAMGLVCGLPPALRWAAALGGTAGYLLFWGQGQPVLWMGLALTLGALAGQEPPHWGFAPALGAMIAAGTGLVSLLTRWEDVPPAVYFFRVGLAAASGAVFGRRYRGFPGRTELARHRLDRAARALETLRLELGVDLSPGPEPGLLLDRAVGAACDTCPERRGCRARRDGGLSPGLLELAGLGPGDLPEGCRKPARLVKELRRGQERLRLLRSQKRQRQAYRGALAEQYGLVSRELVRLSENLIAADLHRPSRFRLNIGICSHSLEGVSGDRCESFEGPGGLYVLLCDGMGTGPGAAAAAERAAGLIRRYLEAGFPAADALESYNSLCLLRDEGGWATVDLLEVDPATGRCRLYKWGAGPSFLLTKGGLARIGTAGPPPGLSQQTRHWVGRLSLGEGDTLILLSDGVAPPDRCPEETEPEALARVIAAGRRGSDDATAAAVRLEACPYITTLRQNNLSKHKM